MDIKKNFEADCYVKNKNLFTKHRSFKTKEKEVIDFNHASLARPYKEVFDKINKELEDKARKKLCALVGIEDTSKIIFGRNTTEALSFVYWLVEVEKGNVVVTDAENESVIRIFREHRDHGNTNCQDGWSTFPDKEVSENFRGIDTTKNTSVELRVANFLKDFDDEEILKQIDNKTFLVLISHVIRNNGRIVDIERLSKKIKERNPNTFIAIDGAQALGNLPKIDFKELEKIGVDFYTATPHKTLGSYPLGVLFISEKAKKNIEIFKKINSENQIIMEGMIERRLGINSNVGTALNPLRFLAVYTAIETLEKKDFLVGGNFHNKCRYLFQLKKKFIEELLKRRIESEEISNQSPAIVSFRVSMKDNQQIVTNLQEKGIFCSYISETQNIRVSFDITNNYEDIVSFFKELDLML